MGITSDASPRSGFIGPSARSHLKLTALGLATRTAVLGLAGALALQPDATRRIAGKTIDSLRGSLAVHFDGDDASGPRAASLHDVGVAVVIVLLLTALRHLAVLAILRPAAARLGIKAPRQRQRFAELIWSGASHEA